MNIWKKFITFTLLLSFVLNDAEFFSDNSQGISFKRGLTFQATIWPQQRNNYVGRMSCNGCNPQSGDTPCTQILPILCIINPKVLPRPYYKFYADYTAYANPDQSFYEGWTGGIMSVTDPVRGLDIDSYVTGDNLCKSAFGSSAKFATFNDGWYLPNMNGPEVKIQKSWNWNSTLSGEYNLWGYFNHNHIGKAWVWTQTIPLGNCILPKSNPIN